MIKVERPPAGESKISTKDSFELCYLRHQYFRRAKFNPTQAEMDPYMKIVDNFTKSTFYAYYGLFKAVGMYHDDILNIGRVHLVSFLGLYSLENCENKRKEFELKTLTYKYREANQEDFDQKNKANFTMFFKQRMEDLVRVCRQKVRNIKGKQSESYSVFAGTNKPPKYPQKLLKDFLDFGYKKIDFSVFKSIRKKADVNQDATMFIFDGVWYVAIALEQSALDLDDLVCGDADPYGNVHNMNPEDLYEEKEKEGLHIAFNKKSDYRKRITLINFLAKNRYKAHYKEEVATAKKLLKTLGN